MVCGAGVGSEVGAACCAEAADRSESEGALFAVLAWVLVWGAVASASVEDAAWAVKWIGRLFSGGAEV